ncbi:MAG: hypothetical protein IKO76_06315 [Butyrivibrio sp.]|nr:hypothetical protein [Butyrivibrio sp.]
MKEEFAIDRFIRKLISERLFEICIGLSLLAAVFIRVFLAPNTELSPDYDFFYKSWVQFYRDNGGLKGLEWAPGDYYVPFNVIYALCSYLPCDTWVPLSILPCICEFVSAFFIYKIFSLLSGKKELSAFVGVATLFLPFVIFNGSLWKQVDAVYTCFLVITLYEVIKENYTKAFISYSIAFTFKLQAIIFLPALLILYLNGGFKKKKFSVLEFFWIPVIFLVAGLPEVLAKHGLKATYFAYFAQTGELQSEGYGMVSFFPNLYNFGFDNYDQLLSKGAVLLLFTVLMFIAFFCYRHRENFDEKKVIGLVIWTAYTCVMLLPGMHERYDYAMLLILTPYAIVCNKKIIAPMIMANLCSLATYATVLFHVDIFPLHYIALVYTAAYVWITIDMVKSLMRRDGQIEA